MDEFLKSITCSGSGCLSWILVLFNILAIFYLVFCSFWKVTKTAKITGWIWSAALLCATVGILIAHTCVYTLLTTIFTAMMIMAILAVILPQPNAGEKEEKEEKSEKLGAYVISKTDDDRYVFAIYDSAKKLIVKSKYSYATLESAKKEICVCRDNGMMAAINDKTGAWIREEFYPTFEMFAKDGKYYFRLKINGKYTIFESDGFDDIKACEKMLERAKKMIASTSIYLNTETAHGKDYERYDEALIAGIEKIPDKQVIEEPIIEQNQTEELAVIEEVAATATEEVIEETVIEEREEASVVESVEETVEEGAEENSTSVEIVDDTVVASEEFTVNGEKIYITYNRSFTAKLIQSSDEVKERYATIKTALMEYGAKSRMSWVNESFYTGRITVAKFGIRGKTLSLYLALNPKEYEETKYIYDNMGEVKKYEQTPMRMKIRSNRSVKWAKELIVEMMERLGKEKKEIEPFIFNEPFKTTEVLVYDRLIKVYTNGDGTETEVSAADFEALRREKFMQISTPIVETPVIEEVVEENELIPDVSEDGTTGGVIFTADRKTLWDKYAELTREQRHYFDRIRDCANDKANIKCIEAKDYLTFKLLKDKLVRLRIRRDMVEAVFMLVGSSFKNTFSDSDIKVKEAATIIRVENDAYLEVALKTLDMQYDALVEERRLHKEEQKAKRRATRRAAKENKPE